MKLSIFLTLAIAVLGVILALKQANNTTKIVGCLIVLLALTTTTRDIIDYLRNRPKPIITIRIDSQFDNNPPTAAAFEVKLTNTGSALARDVIVNLELSFNRDTELAPEI